jgi:hypothetical protein
MFERVIKNLQSIIRAKREHVNDKTGVLTQFTKDEAARDIVEYEQAIAVLESEVAAKCSMPGVPVKTTGTGAATASHEIACDRPPERTGAQQSQPESVWPKCDNSLCSYWKHGAINCTLDKCKW